MSKFRLDRKAFKAQTVHEAANHALYYKNKHWTERLAITAYLNSIAYNYPIDSPPALTEPNLVSEEGASLRSNIGVPPVAIDIMVRVKGLDFDTCYRNAVYFEDDNLHIRTIHKDSLVEAKRQSGRPKDLDDLENLDT